MAGLVCPRGVLPPGLVGAGDGPAVALAVEVADGDDPADGDGLAVRDAPADGEAPPGAVEANPVGPAAAPGADPPDWLALGE